MKNNFTRRYGPRIVNCWKGHCLPSTKKPCWLRRNPELLHGIDIIGFFLSEIGLGQTARLYFKAAEMQRISVNAVNTVLSGRQSESSFRDISSSLCKFNTSLSIDGLLGFRRIRREICREKYNIALPLWELEAFPKERINDLRSFDRLWAPSVFIKENLENAIQREVELIQHPLLFPNVKKRLKYLSGPLKILFFFDFDSFPARKNPEGAVKAFQAAFSNKEDVLLTIKTRGITDAGRRTWLSEQAACDKRIRIIDETLSYKAISELIEDHDVFLSLHRSEGFGLGCAEALAAGKIVVATDYGGTKDFINEETGFPVAWKKVLVRSGEYVDTPGATWADPLIEHAAHSLREIYDAPDVAKKRATFGINQLRRNHSLEVVGRRMREALETV